jgi:predicted DsbA family dithiol-disulfide isomerase
MKVEIYSDVACPWCYIGERRFHRALAAFPGADRVEVVYRSYQLDPNAPEQPEPMTEYLRRRFGARANGMLEHVGAAGRDEGIRIDFENGLIVNTLTAHRLLHLAEREYGATVQRTLAEKLFRAYFERGQDVSDPEVLVALAAEAGMHADRARSDLASGEGLAETRAAIEEASALGVRAVPTFVFDGVHAVEGAQPTSVFLQVLERLQAETVRPGDSGSTDASCSDGACAA